MAEFGTENPAVVAHLLSHSVVRDAAMDGLNYRYPMPILIYFSTTKTTKKVPNSRMMWKVVSVCSSPISINKVSSSLISILSSRIETFFFVYDTCCSGWFPAISPVKSRIVGVCCLVVKSSLATEFSSCFTFQTRRGIFVENLERVIVVCRQWKMSQSLKKLHKPCDKIDKYDNEPYTKNPLLKLNMSEIRNRRRSSVFETRAVKVRSKSSVNIQCLLSPVYLILFDNFFP